VTPLALSRFCLVTSLGAGHDATLAGLREGRSGLARCTFESVDIPTYVGEVSGLDEVRLSGEFARFDCRNNRLAQLALKQDDFLEAVAEARERYGARRVGVFLGTSTSGILQTELAYRQRDVASGRLPADLDYSSTQSTFSVADFVRRYLRLDGPAMVVSSACASTTKVFGTAARMIDAGFCDAAIVGGADTLCLTTLYGFRSLCLTSEAPCRPFDTARDGISIGEAAGFALLERTVANVKDDHVCVLGVGESSDAYHMSAPRPDGVGAGLSMARALEAAGLKPGDIDYINLHGTATRIGDAAEDRAVCDQFGTGTPCSSTKGQTGHTLGASGIVEAIISALCILNQFMPGSPHTQELDPMLKSRYLVEARRARVDRILSNSFGFGGSNCSLVLGRSS
jgi:3-oxoacyl-[acyl-carrier-protein] synthase-1